MNGRRLGGVLTRTRPDRGWRSRLRSSLPALAVVAAGFSAVVWGWNPYDTDSSRVQGSSAEPSSPGSYWAPADPAQWADQSRQARRELAGDWDSSSRWYLTEPAATESWRGADDDDGYGWDAYSAPRDWSERQRWQEGAAWREQQDGRQREPGPRHREFSDPYAQDSFDTDPSRWADDAWRQRSLYDDFAGSRGQAPVRQPEPGSRRSEWGGDGFYAREPAREQRPSKPREDRFNGYRFRHDPDLAAQESGRRNGWDFRPLTERDRERGRGPGLYPQIDERDYVQRGPWRSYQDEGTAFGYHDDGRGSSSGSYWGR